ncbi:LacI family DNA-binding transcriptional regulator [Rhizobiaceae bacterium n13]|uniref:LacI family DNA-binding transcriptional regulator n=1 Tax=Ferirhizobium litorale TaxID=2927786 RepID=A0AAE3QBZ4_9HYPH|nr:LacI family DNA-binding transcriptional regulator [Fererhizobium litorale]MDI7860433.1 LacI family DNA-binding transcriptional regulator [Fererhizobium litorale]MDI7920568.1 LacI family DNA-binding transcriptional regulator [Fererhizobium litorale]
MRPTVHDIAAAAGVSLATVDRVLNGRPNVRGVTRRKVEEAIRELGYVRDVAAANLAKGRIYPFVFILPASDNSFMHGLHDEVRSAMSRSASERTSIRIVEVPAFDPQALVAALDALVAEKPAGVALVAADAPDVRAAVDRLVEAGVPVVTLVSDLTASARAHYAGIDNIAAGRTAGNLLGRFLGGQRGEVAVLAGSMLVRDHRERLEGFSAVMAEAFPSVRVLPVLEGRDDPDRAEALIGDLLSRHPHVIGIYSLGAGNRGLIRALQGREAGQRLTVVAHELTASTRRALQEGLIDAVLNQDAGHEVRSAVRVLKAKADGLPVIAAQERIRIDIFLKDNLP